jgi:hypothetical protein
VESQVRRRADDLGLSADEVAAWEPLIDDDLVAALLSCLVRFEDALAELAR